MQPLLVKLVTCLGMNIMRNPTNSRYSASLINEVVCQVKQQNKLLSQVAKDYGIASRTVYQWVKQNDVNNDDVNKDIIVQQIASLQSQIKTLNQQLRLIA